MAYTPPVVTLDAQGNLFTTSGGSNVPAKIGSLGRLIDLLLTHDATIGILANRLVLATNSIPRADGLTIRNTNGVLSIDAMTVAQLPALPGAAVASDVIMVNRDGYDYHAPVGTLTLKAT